LFQLFVYGHSIHTYCTTCTSSRVLTLPGEALLFNFRCVSIRVNFLLINVIIFFTDFTLWESGAGRTYIICFIRIGSVNTYIILCINCYWKETFHPVAMTARYVPSTIVKSSGYANIHYHIVGLVIDMSLYISGSDAHCYV